MKVPVVHNRHGNGILSDEHALEIVFVSEENGLVYGPLDIEPIGYIHCASGYNYTPEQIAWVEDLVVEHMTADTAEDWVQVGMLSASVPDLRCRTFLFGASWISDDVMRRVNATPGKRYYA